MPVEELLLADDAVAVRVEVLFFLIAIKKNRTGVREATRRPSKFVSRPQRRGPIARTPAGANESRWPLQHPLDKRCNRRVRRALLSYVIMANVVMAYVVMACVVMACVVMASVNMAYVVMAYIAMAYVVMAFEVMSDTVMACL